MQDEIAAARRKKRRRYHVRRLVRFVLALVVLLVAVILANTFTATTWKDMKDGVQTFFTWGGGYPASLGEKVPTQVKQMNRAFAFVTESEFIIKSKSGADLLKEKHGFVSPVIAASGNRAVLFNRGSRDVRVYNRTALVAELKADYAIVDADMSANGVLVVLTKSDRFMSQLSAYPNGKYEKVMSWKGASGFPLSCAVSEDGTSAAVASITTRDGKMYTIITSLDLTRQTERYEFNEIEGLCAGIFCESDGAVTVITDVQAVRLGADGTVKSTYAYGVAPLLYISRDKGSRFALGFGDNSRAAINSVVILGRTLEEVSTIEGCGIIKDMYMSSNRLYILGNQTVSAYALSGTLYKVYDADPRAIGLIEFNNPIQILPDQAQQLTVHKLEEENDVADS